VLIQLPMPRRILVGGIEDRFFEKVKAHAHASGSCFPL
jgi:hypothetical protein